MLPGVYISLSSEINPSNTYMMNSNAGVMSFQIAIAKPVTISDSGPIGGIIAANYLGQVMNEKNLITFDLGGTSCDVSLIQNNRINFRPTAISKDTPLTYFSPGTFAAMGQILADIKHDFVFTHLQDPEPTLGICFNGIARKGDSLFGNRPFL